MGFPTFCRGQSHNLPLQATENAPPCATNAKRPRGTFWVGRRRMIPGGGAWWQENQTLQRVYFFLAFLAGAFFGWVLASLFLAATTTFLTVPLPFPPPKIASYPAANDLSSPKPTRTILTMTLRLLWKKPGHFSLSCRSYSGGGSAFPWGAKASATFYLVNLRITAHAGRFLASPPRRSIFSELGVVAMKKLKNHLPKHRDGSNDPLRRDQHLGLLIP